MSAGTIILQVLLFIKKFIPIMAITEQLILLIKDQPVMFIIVVQVSRWVERHIKAQMQHIVVSVLVVCMV